MGPSGRIGYILHILDCLGQVNAGFIQVLYLGRAPRTKETLPDFLKWRRVTRHPLVFRALTGSQRTLGFWGVTVHDKEKETPHPMGEIPYHHLTRKVTTISPYKYQPILPQKGTH